MKTLVVAFFLAAALAPMKGYGDTEQPYVPASLYPSGSRISFNADLSNEGMDALWDLDAEGEPLMHAYPQRVFLRQSGWMEQSFLQHGKQIAWFILFASSYGTFSNGQNGNVVAYRDLRVMLTKWWHAGLAAKQPQSILPAGASGETETRVIPKLDDGPFLVTSAWWGDRREIEAIAYSSSPRLVGRARLRRMLAAQVRYAASVPQPASTP